MLRKGLVLLTVLISFAVVVQKANAGERNKDRVLQVMTRNMDAGSDFWYVLTAAQNPNSTQLDLLIAVTQTYLEMHMSNIPQRADGIAAEIQATHPDIVALQEVTVLSTGPYQQAPNTVIDNAMEALLVSLQKRGLDYALIAKQKNAQVVLPALDATFSYPIDVGLTDYDVVLVRADLPVSELKVQNIQQDHFNAILNLGIAGQSISFLRGWIAVDAKLRGKVYRVVTTHLESLSNDYQAAQTEELLAGPLSTDMPVILAGDLNSDAHSPSWANGPAFGILTAADFQDTWNLFFANDPGFTWPMYVEDSGIGPHNLQRIDLILTRGGGVRPRGIFLTGAVPVHGLWSSDHAGVVGSFVLVP